MSSEAPWEDADYWLVQPKELDRVIELRWAVEGDEWLHHLMAVVVESSHSSGWESRTREASPGLPVPHMAVSVNRGELRSRLVIVLVENGIVAAIEGNGAVRIEEVEPWVHGVSAALDRVGKSHKDFDWSAAVGTGPSVYARNAGLEEASQVGPLVLVKSQVELRESMGSPIPSFYSRSFRVSWPIVVRGKSRGYDWRTASVVAGRELYRLCGLLSVAWDTYLVLRESPHEGDTSIPSKLPFEKESELLDGVVMRQETVSVPEWATGAWELLDRDSDLQDALTAYYEGIELIDEHPSFALVAFVACIETIGRKLVEPERCLKCDSQLGAAKSFRAAIDLVRSGADAEALYQAYGPRSRTAHAGRLFGQETTFGMSVFLMNILARDPTRDFAYRLVYRLRNAARDLLIREFTAVARESADRLRGMS